MEIAQVTPAAEKAAGRHKFTFLVGLPGSGKSHLGRTLGGVFLDDIAQTCGRERLRQPFDGDSVVIADPALCRPSQRTLAAEMVRRWHPGCEVEWVFFANDPKQCWRNVQERDDGRTISLHSIMSLSRLYEIPLEADVRPVWRGEEQNGSD